MINKDVSWSVFSCIIILFCFFNWNEKSNLKFVATKQEGGEDRRENNFPSHLTFSQSFALPFWNTRFRFPANPSRIPCSKRKGSYKIVKSVSRGGGGEECNSQSVHVEMKWKARNIGTSCACCTPVNKKQTNRTMSIFFFFFFFFNPHAMVHTFQLFLLLPYPSCTGRFMNGT